ncbi:hypothetical protein D3C72_1734270 [compost metagenome]
MAYATLAWQAASSASMPAARATAITSATTARAIAGPSLAWANCPTAQPVTAHKPFNAALNATFSQIAAQTLASTSHCKPAASSAPAMRRAWASASPLAGSRRILPAPCDLTCPRPARSAGHVVMPTNKRAGSTWRDAASRLPSPFCKVSTRNGASAGAAPSSAATLRSAASVCRLLVNRMSKSGTSR